MDAPRRAARSDLGVCAGMEVRSLSMFHIKEEVRKAILEQVERGQDYLVETLCRLIRFPTVNPPGNECDHQQFVAAELRALGLRPRLVEAESGRPNLVAVWPGVGGGSSLLHYAGHADVVSPGDLDLWLYPPFGGEVHDGWIWGRGAVDHKAPIAASLAAMRALCNAQVRLRGDVVFLVPVDEEHGSMAGTRYMVKSGLLYGDMGIYASAGFLDRIFIACAGTLNFEIRVHGQVSHSGYPDAGINAIEQASKLVLALQRMTFDKVNPFWDPSNTDRLSPLRTGTLTITPIQGGEAFNIVPGSCVVQGNRRLIPTETVDEARYQIESVLDGLRREDSNFAAELKVVDAVNGLNVPPDAPVVHLVQTVVKDLGLRPILQASSGGFDARWIVDALGIPMVSYGAGWNGPDGRLCIHAPNECIRVDDLVGMAKGFALIMLGACGLANS